MATPNYDEMREMFRAHTAAAVKVIVDIMSGAGGKGDAVRLSAAKEVLNRGWGKPEPEKKVRDREPPPNFQGKALTQIVSEESAAAGRDPPWGKTPPPPPNPAPVEQVPAGKAPPPPPPPALPPPRNDDPTGYRAKRALFSGPPAKT